MKVKVKLLNSLIILMLPSVVQASVNEIDSAGRTKLMNEISAWRYGDSLEKINAHILEPSFNPHVKDNLGRTAFDYAQKYKVKPIEYVLAKKEFSKHYKRVNNYEYESIFSEKISNTQFIKAVANGHLTQVKRFLTEHKDYELKYEMSGGITPLSAVSLIKDIDLSALMFNELVANGANVNEVLVYQNGDTLGHVFCAKDNYLMLLLAISKGYDINLKNKDGLDVYEYSYKNGKKYCQASLENIVKVKDGKIL
ncbi:hypothetical protein QTV49_000413 [Vibrio vulnificus]|nr:hypothetical protein [Vibrio vulnificus]